jgi:lysophospholipase L1-like esterase
MSATAPAAPPAARPRAPLSRRKKLAFALVTVAAFFGLVEAGLRTKIGWGETWLDCHRGHPVLGWCLREGWSGEQSWTGGRSHVNEQGLRDDEPALPRPPGERRLLAVGDSVTFGADVRTDEAYPARLQEALRGPGRPWRVLNGGVTSYDAGQEADWLEEFGWRLEPDVVTVAFCRNDLDPSDREHSVKRHATGAAVRWLTEHSATAFYLERLTWFGRAALNRSGAPAGPAPFAVVEEPYRRIAAGARERGVPVVLIVFPTLDLLQGKAHDDLSGRLRRLGDELGWRVIDLGDALDADPALFLPGDPVHPSAEGYRRVGVYLARQLEGDLPR